MIFKIKIKKKGKYKTENTFFKPTYPLNLKRMNKTDVCG